MPNLYRSSVIHAPLETVWQTVRDFGALADWHPAVAECDIEDDKRPDQIGCVRRLKSDDGEVFREQLLCLSDIDCVCTYSMIEAPMGIENHVAILQLTEITNGNSTFAQWSAEFDCDPDLAAEVTLFMEQEVFQAGFDALEKHLGED